MGLSAKERVFVNEYLRLRNATKAAKIAGYSAKTARIKGSQLLAKINVAEEIAKRQERVAEKAELKAADVLAEIRKLAFVKLKDAYNEDGTLKLPHEMPEDVQAALNSLESDEIFAGPRGMKVKVGETKKIRLTDKVRALEMLAKHFKLLTEIHEHTGKDGGPQVVIMLPGNGSEVPPKEEG